ncbi:nucleoside-diphosphate sugar epimerase/dehydratase [Pelagicoccus sp. SDUM812003]|uniref:polysaccharide biosynthesis protein n=1 Tax=Pelagicoccus sp. SDUM812003 TaxID=3041267 RepID=UPI00280CE2FF|nr:nucleoside-diphosphate sugar epimerase/dehydratase [Pelagicoccus sp. SDUM812003]MDQ8205642.1 nucleoside-diphosphate sugar epimerase/dehydratase [Pelagicoccus sp. SDUM812003]
MTAQTSLWLKQQSRIPILLVSYGLLCAASVMLAFEFRDSFTISDRTQGLLLQTVFWLIPIKLLSLLAFGQFKGLLTFFRLPDVYRLAAAMGAPMLVFLVASFYSDLGLLASKSAIVLDYFFSVSLICVFRTSLRIFREKRSGMAALSDGSAQQRVAIYGAGQTGAALAAHLMSKSGKSLVPVAFVDDDSLKWNKHVHGLKVYRSVSALMTNARDGNVTKLIVAMPTATPSKIREITEQAERFEIPIETVPSWDDLVSGRKKLDKLRPVKIDDLLGRNSIELHSKKVLKELTGKVVMVTGAGGTIGGELCHQIAQCNPSMLLMVERAEYLLFQTEQKIKTEFPEIASHAFIGDITDEARMDFLLGGFLPDVIFHAAAHKHVPMMEHQPGEAIRNNTLGTALLADLAIKHEVERFVFISTDKAVNPTNVMGVSKRLAEIFLQSIQGSSKITQFVAVRFGNVLGSSGSVIPTFKRQLEEGGPLTVTHPEITRYFMTVPEAVGLVLECSIDAAGGEIFVLDMGEPMKIYDLAKQMIKLSGLRVGEDVEIKFTGLRPGEKLYEELQHGQETLELTENKKVFRFTGQRSDEAEVRKFLRELSPLLRSSDYNALKRKLNSFVPEYIPDFSAPQWAPAHAEVGSAYRHDGVKAEGAKIVSFKGKTA